MYFEDAAGKFSIVNQTGGMLVYALPPPVFVDIYILSPIFEFFVCYITGPMANFCLATIFPVVPTSKHSPPVSV